MKSKISVAGIALGLMLACQSATADEDPAKGSWKIDTAATTTSVVQGQKGKVALSIVTLKDELHISQEAPLKIDLASTGLKLDKTTLAHADAVDPKSGQPKFEVPFTADQKGSQTIDANLNFFVCSPKWCLKQKEKVTLKVDVK
jgi:hypothetical protein